MRAALAALAEELRRLQADGMRTVAVSDDSLAALRHAVRSVGGPPVGRPAVVRAPDRPRPGAGATGRNDGPGAAGAAPPASAPGLPSPPNVALPAGSKAERWAALLRTVVDDPVCKAHLRPGKKVVLGVGGLDSRIMFVGEAPGAEEEIQGEPFVGPAGQLLTKMIGAMGLQRGEVYIGNIMNWRPELPLSGGVQVGNRPPNESEMSYCLPYLRAQVEIVDPAILVALGSTAAQGLLGFGTFRSLGEVRGRWREFAGRPLIVTYHPSYILRNQSNRAKRMIWEDLLQVMERAGLPISEKQRAYFSDR